MCTFCQPANIMTNHEKRKISKYMSWDTNYGMRSAFTTPTLRGYVGHVAISLASTVLITYRASHRRSFLPRHRSSCLVSPVGVTRTWRSWTSCARELRPDTLRFHWEAERGRAITRPCTGLSYWVFELKAAIEVAKMVLYLVKKYNRSISFLHAQAGSI